MWATAEKAIGNNSYADFKELYEDLRKYWQVFRSSKSYTPPGSRKVFNLLDKLNARFLTMKLSGLKESDMESLWEVLAKACEIKRNTYCPSMMAVSKFLHFWNPRLFVIVDRARMWEYAFKHQWIWEDIEGTYNELEKALPDKVLQAQEFNGCDFRYYPAILLWCSRIIRDNPNICSIFYKYLCDKYHNPPKYLKHYEAAAVEWLLCGLVELPPKGVEM